MMQFSAYSRLDGDSQSIDTHSGKTMTVAIIAINIAERGVEDPVPEWHGIVAFRG